MNTWQFADEMPSHAQRASGDDLRPSWTAELRRLEAEILAAT